MERLRTLSERNSKTIHLQRSPRRWILSEDGIRTVISIRVMGKTDCWKLFCEQISQMSELESVSVDGRIRKLEFVGT